MNHNRFTNFISLPIRRDFLRGWRLCCLLLFFLILNVSRAAANNEALYRQAVKLQQETRWSEALPIFKSLLKSDSSNVEYLWRTAYLYAQLGAKQAEESQRQQWYSTAAYLGQKAARTAPKNAWAHYAYALALGRMNEQASSRTKIEYAKLIKSEAELALKYDAGLAGAHHILGRWHRVVAGFNMLERAMIKAVFGGMPGGSYEEALSHFEKAIALEPGSGIHYFEIANTLLERDESGDKARAIKWLEKSLTLPVKTEQDKSHRALCKELLEKSK